MQDRRNNLFWGIILILVAAAILAQSQGLIDFQSLSPTWVTWIFAGVGVLFLVRYLISGLKEWGWLFPACILAALTVIIVMGASGRAEPFLASLIFIAVAIPFLVAFLLNVRSNWWALIPAFSCLVVGAIIVLADRVAGEWIGALVMFSVGLPFLVVYLVNRSRQWALIPAFCTLAVGAIILISMANNWAGVFVPFIIAIPFFYVYFTKPAHWWALIPAGILTSICVEAILTQPFMGAFADTAIPVGFMFLGWAVTFYLLWLRRKSVPTAWAQVVAIVFVILAIIQIMLGALAEIGLIVMLFAAGILLLFYGLRPKKAA
jgi:hypothetical protein